MFTFDEEWHTESPAHGRGFGSEISGVAGVTSATATSDALRDNARASLLPIQRPPLATTVDFARQVLPPGCGGVVTRPT